MIQYIIPTKGNAKVVPSIAKISTNNKIFVDNDSNRNIFEKYNHTLGLMNISDDDVIVFVHDDIEILDEYIEKKLEMYFSIKKNVGIAGVIGTTIFPKMGGWWMVDRTRFTRGRIVQGSPTGIDYPMTEQGGMDDTHLVAIDGCIMCMRGSIAKTFSFDIDTYTAYHFYDCDSCFRLLEQGWDIGIIDILVKHESEGPLDDLWRINKDKFINKWESKGYTFPITKQQFKKDKGK